MSRGRIGVAVFSDDFQTIRSLAERDNTGITHWSELPRGGHYAAQEVPAEVVADLRKFFADSLAPGLLGADLGGRRTAPDDPS